MKGSGKTPGALCPERPGSARGREGGFTYVALLFAIVVIGITLASTGRVWSTVIKRERERELIFRGGAIRGAIERYYKMTGIKGYPKSLKDLLDDKRQPVLTRHLRKIYADPMTGRPDWVLIKAPDGGINGVRSRSKEKPYKKGNFPAELSALEGKARYSDWEFVYAPEKLAANQGRQGAKKQGAAAGSVAR